MNYTTDKVTKYKQEIFLLIKSLIDDKSVLNDIQKSLFINNFFKLAAWKHIFQIIFFG